MNRILTAYSLTILSAITFHAPSAKAEGALGMASDYNVFVFGDMNQSSDSEGRVAVGGNATLTNFGIADRLANSNGAKDSLIVGGNLNYNGGQVFGGNAVVGGQVQSGVNFNCGGCSVKSGNPIDFAAAKQQYTNISQNLAALTATGSSALQWGGLALNGSGSGTQLFNLDGALFSQASYVDFHGMNSNSTVILNILGDSVRFNNMGLNLNGVDKTKVLFNFVNATQIQASGFSFSGSVLAPTANLNFSNGNLEGNLIAQSVSGSGEFHNYRYAGELPISVGQTPAPVPAPVAVVPIPAPAAPAPVAPIPAPVAPAPTPVAPIPAPVAPAPISVVPAPATKLVPMIPSIPGSNPVKSVPEPGSIVGLVSAIVMIARRRK